MSTLLAEVQTLRGQVAALDARIETLLDAQARQAELIHEMGPVMKDAMAVATERLQGFDERGYFAFGRELGRVVDRVVTNYDEEDVRQLGDNIVGIVDTVRSLTQPDVMKIAHEAAEALHEADEAKPTGLLGMLKRSRDDDVRRGMAVGLEILRHIGRATSRATSDAKVRRKRRVAAMLAPSRALPQREARAPAASAKPKPAPTPAAAPALEIPGLALTADGFLADTGAWTRDIAVQLAGATGIEMTETHWQVVEWIRADYAETGASPNVRRIAKGSGVGTRDLYTLFVKAPGITAARIAGVPKPVGCI